MNGHQEEIGTMALDQKRRSLFSGHVYAPPVHRIDGEDVIYVCDIPYELEDIVYKWLMAYPTDRALEGPRGLAVTQDTWHEMIGWALNRLAETVPNLPLQESGGIKFVVFDAFGTLCRIRDPRHTYGKLLRHCDDRATARELVMTKPLTLRDAGRELGVYDDALIASLEADLAAELASIELYPEVVDVLHGWKERGIKIAVASNLAMPYADSLLKLLPFPLDVYAWSFEVGYTKPERPFYGWVTDQLGGDAAIGIHNTVLWMGDSLPNDYCGPIDFGMRAILIERVPTGVPSGHSRALMVLPELPHPQLIRGLA